MREGRRGMEGRRLRWLAVLVCAALARQAAAETTEFREFSVQVDGKPVGQTQLVITDRDDGTTVVHNQANVRVKILITYEYKYQGTEVWKNYQLLRLDGRCDDNRKQLFVQAAPDEAGRGLKVRSQSDEKVVPGDLWTTSYWKLPDPKFFNQALTLLDADRGKVYAGQLQYVGTEQRPVAGQPANCYHFRLTGGKTAVNLWFDAHHRLVRQEFEELGHQTVIELTGLRRGNPAAQPATGVAGQ